MKLICFLRALLLFILIPIFTLFCSMVTLFVIAPFAPKNIADGWIRFWARGMLRLSGTRVQVKGLSHMKGLDSSILVSNHMSHFDIPVLYVALPISFRMVAKMELFKIPIFGRSLRALGFVPVVRDSSEGGKKVFQEMQDKFKTGQCLWMAPEGTRFSGIGVGDFKLGAFYLALKAAQPIVPICIYGTHKVLGKNSLLVNWDSWTRDVVVHILPPTFISKEDPRTRKELRDEVRNQILEEFSKIHTSNGDHGPSKKVGSQESSVFQNPM